MIGSPLQLIIILAIVLVLFGANKLRNIGGDLGGAIKNFRQSVRDGETKDEDKPEFKERIDTVDSGRVIEAHIVDKDHSRNDNRPL